MKKRNFLAASLALALTLPATSMSFAAGTFQNYTPGAIQSALKAGKTVFVDYSASWCTTCAAQARQIDALVKENPNYKKSMTFIKVDWDAYGRKPVSTDRKIPRRSTLLVLKGNKELGRIVAGTSKSAIKGLMDKGV